MNVLKKNLQMISIILLLLISTSLPMISYANPTSRTSKSNVGIRFTEKESNYQVIKNIEDSLMNNQIKGGDEKNSSGDDQFKQSIFPQTGEQSTIKLTRVGLLIVSIMVGYLCHKKYKNQGKKEKI